MNKQAKYGRFEAQQYLEAEIRAKQQALDELRSVRARCDETERELCDARRMIKQLKEELERREHEVGGGLIGGGGRGIFRDCGGLLFKNPPIFHPPFAGLYTQTATPIPLQWEWRPSPVLAREM